MRLLICLVTFCHTASYERSCHTTGVQGAAKSKAVAVDSEANSRNMLTDWLNDSYAIFVDKLNRPAFVGSKSIVKYAIEE